MLDLRVTVAGEETYHRAFQALDSELGDMLAPLTAIRDSLAVNARDQFATEGAAGGSPWAQLNAAYETWKRQHYPQANQILVRTGALEHLLTDPRQATIELTPQRLEWGVPDGIRNAEGGDISVYGAAHQSGSDRLPQRKIINLTDAELRGWDRIIVRWIAELRRTVGLAA